MQSDVGVMQQSANLGATYAYFKWCLGHHPLKLHCRIIFPSISFGRIGCPESCSFRETLMNVLYNPDASRLPSRVTVTDGCDCGCGCTCGCCVLRCACCRRGSGWYLCRCGCDASCSVLQCAVPFDVTADITPVGLLSSRVLSPWA